MYWQGDSIVTAMRSHMRDPTSTAQRWSDDELQNAINYGIGQFSGRVGYYVEAPMVGDDNDLWVAPFYMQDQIIVLVDGVPTGTIVKPGDPIISDATIKGWVYNPTIPFENYTVAEELASGGDTLTITGTEIPPDQGHILIGLELIRYNDISLTDSSTFVLNNLQRNMNGGGDNVALMGSVGNFSIWYDNHMLKDILMGQASSYLHQLYITDGSPTEVQHHQWSMRWNTQQAERFWRRYVPNKEYQRLPARRPY